MLTTVEGRSALRAGEWVRVREIGEILATLDSHGRLEQMPFMPEMFSFCGQRFRVAARAHKTCDPAVGIGGRRLKNAVHLENLRCDGAAHDGCEAACLIFWKEAWLERDDGTPKIPPQTPTPGARPTADELTRLTKIAPAAGETEPTYMCQNTQVSAATEPLRWWDVRQYLEDVTSGNITVGTLLSGVLYAAWRTVAEAGIGLGSGMRWLYDTFQAARGGSPYPIRPPGVPDGAKTPKQTLDLVEGEFVRVKSHAEILKTVDSTYRNRGLYFDVEMVPYTGKVFRVARRLSHIIDERTHKMVRFKSDAVTLEGVYCRSRYSFCRRHCPRAITPYWREIWLERAGEPGVSRGDEKSVANDQSR